MRRSSHTHAHARPLTESGITLVELLISVVVFGALMAGVAQLVATNSQNANATGTLARIEDTGRTAIELLSADIRRAGYLGGNIMNTTNADFDMILGTLGDSAVEIACNPDTNNWARMVGQPIVGVDEEDTVGLENYACITADDNNYQRGDILTLRYAGVGLDDDAVPPNKRPYLRTTPIVGRLFLGENVVAAENQIADPIERVYALAAHSYYVGLTDRSCDGNPIPALYRKKIGDDGSPVSEELLAGVENIQFRYLVENQYFDAIDVPNWLAVQAVETTVLAKAECPEAGFRNTREFTIGGAPYTPADNFRRQLFTATTQLRN